MDLTTALHMSLLGERVTPALVARLTLAGKPFPYYRERTFSSTTALLQAKNLSAIDEWYLDIGDGRLLVCDYHSDGTDPAVDIARIRYRPTLDDIDLLNTGHFTWAVEDVVISDPTGFNLDRYTDAIEDRVPWKDYFNTLHDYLESEH